MHNILVSALVLEKEESKKSDKGEFNMVHLWLGTGGPLPYVRVNMPKDVYDIIEEGNYYGFIVDYRFFGNSCTGLKVNGLDT